MAVSMEVNIIGQATGGRLLYMWLMGLYGVISVPSNRFGSSWISTLESRSRDVSRTVCTSLGLGTLESRSRYLGPSLMKCEIETIASHENHVINWSAATILDRESDKSTRWIKEAVHIRKKGRQSLNRDEGSYMLSHTYDRFLATSHHYCGKNRKKNWSYLFWWRSLIETETSKVKMLVVIVNSIFLISIPLQLP